MGFRSITTNKANGGDGIPAELFKILKDDAVKVLHSLCQQIWKTQQWPRIHLQCRRLGFDPWVRKIPWRKKWQPTPVIHAWRIPWTEEPGGLQFMGSQRVGHDCLTLKEPALVFIDYFPI